MKTGILICSIFLNACTTTYFIQNSKGQPKNCRIVFDNCQVSDISNYTMARLKKINKINNLNETFKDGVCEFNFRLAPEKRIALTEQFSIGYPIKTPLEKRLFYLINGENIRDTLFYKIGNKVVLNKFDLRSKFTLFLGKRTYLYTISQ